MTFWQDGMVENLAKNTENSLKELKGVTQLQVKQVSAPLYRVLFLEACSRGVCVHKCFQ